MNKLEMIAELKDAGTFDLTQEILDAISADTDPAHASGNKSIRYLIKRIHDMTSWPQFDAKEILDFSSRAFGFVRYAFDNNLDICTDVEDALENLHDILWQRVFNALAESRSSDPV